MRIFKKNGFSLVELLVVVFIVTLLSSVIFVKYRNGQKQYILSGAVQELKAEIRNVQNMAMQGAIIGGKCDTDEENQCSGYGVYIKKNNDFYIVFGDKGGAAYTYQAPPVDALIETIYLPENIIIESTSNKEHIFFESPWPTGYIDGNQDKTAVITLKYEGTSLAKSITITSAGLVE